MVIFRPRFSHSAPAPFIPFNKKCWNIYVDKAYNIPFIYVSMNWSTVWQQGLPNISSKVHGDEMKVDSISNRNKCSYIWICKDSFLLNSLTWRLINNDSCPVRWFQRFREILQESKWSLSSLSLTLLPPTVLVFSHGRYFNSKQRV